VQKSKQQRAELTRDQFGDCKFIERVHVRTEK